jgi:hypothetical protein
VELHRIIDKASLLIQFAYPTFRNVSLPQGSPSSPSSRQAVKAPIARLQRRFFQQLKGHFHSFVAIAGLQQVADS